MNPEEVLRIVEQIHLARKIDKETVFVGVEQALVIAARKHSDAGDDANVEVYIDRQTGEINAYRDNVPLTPEEISERIGAQTAKQVIIQKIRDAERDAIYDEYAPQVEQIIVGKVHRNEGGATLVTLPNVEAILPRSEKIPGETLRPGVRARFLIVEVRKAGSKVKVILSRSRPLLVKRLFEQEVPEIAEGVVEIKEVSREPGHRAKIAVASDDPRIDLVGACVGMRGARSRNVTEELNGERVDVVPWSDDPAQFIQSALKPSVVDEVLLCPMLGRAIVLVQRDQRSLAIGRRGQNVRLASKLCGWDVDIMTRDELAKMIDKAMEAFVQIEGVTIDLANQLVGEGVLSYDDLSIVETDDLVELGGLTEEQALAISAEAERRAEAADDLARVDGVSREMAERLVGGGVASYEELKTASIDKLVESVGVSEEEAQEVVAVVKRRDDALVELGKIKGVTRELAERLVGEGFASYRELADAPADKLARKLGILREETQMIVDEAKRRCEAMDAAKPVVPQEDANVVADGAAEDDASDAAN
ncbi:MAG: transcription termination factor NusA [Thermoguttaceae bacterium]|nr:transcription termination factor NusA [Thermoguttaceae bacterium]